MVLASSIDSTSHFSQFVETSYIQDTSFRAHLNVFWGTFRGSRGRPGEGLEGPGGSSALGGTRLLRGGANGSKTGSMSGQLLDPVLNNFWAPNWLRALGLNFYSFVRFCQVVSSFVNI